MVYIFLSDNNSIKETVIPRFVSFLQTDSKNWKKPVFHVNMAHYGDFMKTELLRHILELIDSHGCDVVVNADAYYIQNREQIKKYLVTDIQEIQLTNSRTSFDVQSEAITIDISRTSPTTVLNNIITHYKK